MSDLSQKSLKRQTAAGTFRARALLGVAAISLAIVGLGSVGPGLGCRGNAKAPSQPSDGGPTSGGGSDADLVPDFRLMDLNPASTTAGKYVSPRDMLGKVSAWYFGHST